MNTRTHSNTMKELITKFYTAFANGDARQMIACYHEEVVFKDPAFGTLKGQKACKMWEMLLSKKEAIEEVSFGDIQSTENTASADWKVVYYFGPKKRKVINEVHATFTFKDGKIIEHTDDFDIWKWSKQALGTAGLLLGWTPLVQTKIQKLANKNLEEYISPTLPS